MYCFEVLEARTLLSVSLVKDISSPSSPYAPNLLTAVGDSLFFVLDDQKNGSELWKSDGTADGTVMVKDIATGSASSSPQSLFSFKGSLYFSADDRVKGREMWKSDGTPEGTQIVTDLYPGSNGSFPAIYAVVNDRLIFTASTSAGNRLWATDGNPNGAVELTNVTPQTGTSVDVSTAVWDGYLYYPFGANLWRTNGTPGGTAQVATLGKAPAEITAGPGGVFFRSTNLSNTIGDELFTSDGTADGTRLVKDILPGTRLSSLPMNLMYFNGAVYFQASNGSNAEGTELWKSDGTETGTVLVKNIYPGSGSSYPGGFRPVGNTLFFVAFDPTGSELWRTDGTGAGTYKVKEINPSPTAYSDPMWLTDFNGVLYFSADDGTSGRELWTSDGTANGTVLVQDINPGQAASYPSYFAATGRYLFFTARDATHGTEVWAATDVTPPTVLGIDYRYDDTVPGVRVRFSEAVLGVDPADLIIEDAETGATISPGAGNVSYDAAAHAATFTFPGYTYGAPPNGTYRARIATASVTDASAQAIGAPDSAAFYVLAGDADHNAMVDINDFNILARNYGRAGMRFSEGNFDYSADGQIAITDFNLLAANFGRSVDPAASPRALATTSARSSTLVKRSSGRSETLLEAVSLRSEASDVV